LADEIDGHLRSGVIKRWLDRETTHAFAEAFVKGLVVFMNSCLDVHREDVT
jgi:hypothetical protein